jgi:hypothetical protein
MFVRPVNWYVLEHHEVSELPPRLFFPGITQLQLADGNRVVTIIPIGFENDDLARVGSDDEIRVVVDEAIDPEAALLNVSMPELDAAYR